MELNLHDVDIKGGFDEGDDKIEVVDIELAA